MSSPFQVTVHHGEGRDSRQEQGVGTEVETMEESCEPHFHSKLSFLCYTTQDHLTRGSTTHSELSPPQLKTCPVYMAEKQR